MPSFLALFLPSLLNLFKQHKKHQDATIKGICKNYREKMDMRKLKQCSNLSAGIILQELKTLLIHNHTLYFNLHFLNCKL